MSTAEHHRLPAPSTHVFAGTVDGSSVLFNSQDRRLHVLNRSAAAVWEELKNTESSEALLDAVAAQFSTTVATVAADVARTIDHFVEVGLAGDIAVYSPPTSPVVERPAARVSTVIDVAGSRVGLYFDDPEVAATMARITSCLPVKESSAGEAWISLSHDDGAWTFASSLHQPTATGSRVSGVLRCVAEINSLAIDASRTELVFHAGAVTNRGRAVLLPAASNRGKSTLTTSLVLAGFDYLTDEAAVVTSDLAVQPFPKAISLDPGSFPLFESIKPVPANRLDKALARREWNLDPSRIGRVGSAAPVVGIVCPHYQPDAAIRGDRLSKTDALHTLLGESFDFRLGGEAVFDTLLALVDRVPVYRLVYSDLDLARGAIEAILGDRF